MLCSSRFASFPFRVSLLSFLCLPSCPTPLLAHMGCLSPFFFRFRLLWLWLLLAFFCRRSLCLIVWYASRSSHGLSDTPGGMFTVPKGFLHVVVRCSHLISVCHLLLLRPCWDCLSTFSCWWVHFGHIMLKPLVFNHQVYGRHGRNTHVTFVVCCIHFAMNMRQRRNHQWPHQQCMGCGSLP